MPMLMTDEQRAAAVERLTGRILDLLEPELGSEPVGEVLDILGPAAILAISVVAVAAGGTRAGIVAAIHHYLPMIDEAFAAAAEG